MMRISILVALFSVLLLLYLQCIYIVQMPERNTAKLSSIRDIQDVKHFQFKDGRILSYSDDNYEIDALTNDSNSAVLFVFPGTPGSRLFRHPDTRDILAQLNKRVRIITFDRFHVGFSSPRIITPSYLKHVHVIGDDIADHRVHEWAHVIGEFADAHNISKFAVAGFSTGAPYALSVAHRFPNRVSSVFLISGVVHQSLPITLEKRTTSMLHTFGSNARFNLLYRSLLFAPTWLIRYTIKFLSIESYLSAPRPVLGFLRDVSSSNKAESELLSNPNWSAMLTDTIVEFYRNTSRGHSDDLIALATLSYESPAWTKLLSEISNTTSAIPIHVYHGEQDALVDALVVAQVYRQLQHRYGLSNVQLRLLENLGHFSTFAHAWKDVLSNL